MAAAGLDPVSAAKSRISTCERYGMAVDPRDVEIARVAESCDHAGVAPLIGGGRQCSDCGTYWSAQ